MIRDIFNIGAPTTASVGGEFSWGFRVFSNCNRCDVNEVVVPRSHKVAAGGERSVVSSSSSKELSEGTSYRVGMRLVWTEKASM